MLKTYPFTREALESVKLNPYGSNWPVVYIINNKKEAYVGETINAYIRMTQHLRDFHRASLEQFHIISDDTFNKSAILDTEAFLIKHMSVDHKFELQNLNSGVRTHNYYNKETYEVGFTEIWKQLKNAGLVNRSIKVIENTNLFKYSPYKSLSADQYLSAYDMMSTLLEHTKKKEPAVFLVNGEAGTGKSVLAVYLVKLITDVMNEDFDHLEEDAYGFHELLYLRSFRRMKVGLVIPMSSFRTSLRKVFKKIPGLDESMVLAPSRVKKGEYDLLIVDEAHRLRREVNVAGYQHAEFTRMKETLGRESVTELDWIMECSNYQILLYDKNQMVRPTDVRNEDFKDWTRQRPCSHFQLDSQLRVKGGKDYLTYIKKIFSHSPPKRKQVFKEYELKLYDHLDDMVQEIQKADNRKGLCRVISGYAWQWKTKGIKLEEIQKRGLYDIEEDGKRMIWNHRLEDWVPCKNAINEVGCIHTIQGYDLNYAGVIIGNDLQYNKKTKRLEIHKECYFDANGKKSLKNEQELEEYILNIYYVLMSRGIYGTYVYVCDEGLREYLKRFIDHF